MPIRAKRVVAALLLTALAATARAQAPSFQPLGFLPGGGVLTSDATGISADGTAVVGRSTVLPEAFRWTAGGGMVGLGSLGGPNGSSRATATSADGSIVVGISPTVNGDRAFVWTAATGMQLVDPQTPVTLPDAAYGVSADGSVVVGERGSFAQLTAVRWTAAGVQALGSLPGGLSSAARAVSADGEVVVGVAAATAGGEAFRWTAATGMVGLGDLPGGVHSSSALAVDADGSVVVGWGRTDVGNEAVRWTTAGGIEALGFVDPAADRTSLAYAVSADGVVVGGTSGGPQLPSIKAFLWTEATGMVDVRAMLLQRGATGLGGWLLHTVTALSADGRCIAGGGTNPSGESEAWLAVLPDPWTAYCTAKTNSLGCTPRISAAGTPSASNATPFVARVDDVRNGKAGLFLYVVNGSRQALPFQGGMLCLGPQGIRRSPALSAGGNPPPANDCSGAYVLDFNAFAAGLAGGSPDPALGTPGNTYLTQAWGRDQGFAPPNNTTLSDGFDVTIGP